MKKLVLATALIAAVLTLGLGLGYAQNAAPAYNTSGWYCPYHSQVVQGRYTQANANGWYCPRIGYRHGTAWNNDNAPPRYTGCPGYGAKYRTRSHARHHNAW